MDTLLHRQGSKRRIADRIVPLFPKHDLYIELFFGAGGLFFNKKKADYNICNDINDDIFNLFKILQDVSSCKVLKDYMRSVPISESLFNYWRTHLETDAIKKAGRFLFLSNYTYLCSGRTLNYGIKNDKQIMLDRLDIYTDYLSDVQFMCCDFREVLRKVSLRKQDRDIFSRIFIYADPPYLSSSRDTYKTGWSYTDSVDLFANLVSFSFDNSSKFCISEFADDTIIELARKYDLFVTDIGERQNLQNRRSEILITNYDTNEINKSLF